MTYFKNIDKLEDLKSQWRKLAMAHHPDKGGDTATMQAINGEYDKLFPIYRNKHNAEAKAAEQYNHETADETRSQFYTANGWAGENYKCGRSTKEIAAIIRKHCKDYFPDYKFSVAMSASGNSINISMMEAPHEVFLESNEKGHIQLNHYYLKEESRVTERTKAVFIDVLQVVNSYRMDDSDSMIDYFHTNFYFNMNVGAWNKPFKVVECISKLKAPRTEKKREQPTSAASKAIEESKTGSLVLTEETDTRNGSVLWVARLTEKMNREEFLEIAEHMKEKKGVYSKFKGGFIFREQPTL